MTLVRFENKNELFVIKADDILKCAYLPDVKYATQEQLKEFEEKYDVKIKFDKENVIKKLKEKGYSEEESEEIINDFIDDEMDYLPQIYPGIYCEDVIYKKDIEKLENENVLFFDKSWEEFYDILSDGDFDEYYGYWDGHNHRIEKIEEKYEINPEEIEELYEGSNTNSYNYYKIKDNEKETVIFRVFNSFYEGELPFVDEEWKQHREDFEDLL